jgi:hypothetical protein
MVRRSVELGKAHAQHVLQGLYPASIASWCDEYSRRFGELVRN